MAIAATLLTSANSSTDANTYTTASISPAANSLLLVFVWSSHATTAPDNVVTGLSLTWTQRAVTTNSTASRKLTCITAQCGASPGSGALTITSTASIGDAWAVIQITGHDTTTPVVQAPTSPTNTTSALTGSITLAAAGNANNRPFAAFGHRAQTATTPRTNWTELSDDLSDASAPIAGFETQWRSDAFETTASATWTTSSQWSGIAVEIAASTGGTTQALASNIGVVSTSSALLGIGMPLGSTLAPGLTQSAQLGISQPLVSTVNDLTSFTAALTQTLGLASSIADTTSLAAGLSQGLGLTSSITDVTTLTALLGVVKQLASTTVLQSALTASLTRVLGLASQVDGVSTFQGTIGLGKALASSVASSTVLLAGLGIPRSLASSLALTTALTASLVADHRLAAGFTVTTTLIADLRLSNQVTLNAVINAISSLNGSLRISQGLAVTVNNQVNLTSLLGITKSLTSVDIFNFAGFSGLLGIQRNLLASISNQSNLLADLHINPVISFVINLISTLNASLNVGVGLSSTIDIATSLISDLSTLPAILILHRIQARIIQRNINAIIQQQMIRANVVDISTQPIVMDLTIKAEIP